MEVENVRGVLRLLSVADELEALDTGGVIHHRDGRVDRLWSGNANADWHSHGEPQLVGEHDIRRIGDCDEDGTVVEEADRNCSIAPGQDLR